MKRLRLIILALSLLISAASASAQTIWTVQSLAAGIAAWNSSTPYVQNDIVSFQQNIWIGQTSSLNDQPGETAAWRSSAGLNSWNSASTYAPGSMIVFLGDLYVASVSTTNDNPRTSPSKWSPRAFTVSPTFTSMGIGINPTSPARLSILPETSTGTTGENFVWTTAQGGVIDVSNYSTNNTVGLYVNVKQAASVVAQRNKTGIAVTAYHPPDNGGEVSGIFSIQRGGGNAISLFKASKDAAPGMGQTAFPLNGYAMEIQSGDAQPAIFATTGNASIFVSGGVTTNGQVMDVLLGQSGSRGIIVGPNDGVTFDTRAAYEVGNFDVSSSVNAGIQFQVRMNGAVGVGQTAPASGGQLSVLGLKTTGAAGGKKVVCVDTATGQLFASSTGTDCSN